MRIPFSLLSSAPRQEWLSVPASREDRSLGVGRVLARELPSMVFESLWGDLVAAEAAVREQQEANSNTTPALLQAREAERAAIYRFVQSQVIAHDPSTFEATLPEALTKEEGAALVSALVDAGFSEEEGREALERGKVCKPFEPEEFCFDDLRWQACSLRTVRFYERCQPDRQFLMRLLGMLYRFQCGELISAERVWESATPRPFAESK